MIKVVEQMVQSFEPKSLEERKNAIKQVMQEIALCGLSRAGFFDKAVFYGGTALRIFHDLDRFSEDLDFSLRDPDPDFRLQRFLPILEKEVQSFGIHLTVQQKEKSMLTNIQTAFTKGETREHLLHFYPEIPSVSGTAAGEKIQIKLEIDINPPGFATFENRYRLMPLPYSIALYDMPSLFAGKIHAVLCRGWKNRVKGRDLYDYIHFLSRGTPFNLEHLRERLVRSGAIKEGESFTASEVRELLHERFTSLNYDQARTDVLPFIGNPAMLDLWNADFFTKITQELKPDENGYD